MMSDLGVITPQLEVIDLLPAPSGPALMQMASTAVKLSILALKRDADWDGEGAEAITQEMCDSAVQFLQECGTQVPLPRITPSARGGISMYWVKDDEHFLIEIGLAPDQARFQLKGPGEFRDHGTASSEKLVGILRSAFGREG